MERIQERTRRLHSSDVAQEIAQRAAELLVREIRAKGGHLAVPLDVAFGRHRRNAAIKYRDAQARRAEHDEPLVDDTHEEGQTILRAQVSLPDFTLARTEEIDLASFFRRLRKTMRGCTELQESGAELNRYLLALKDTSKTCAALYSSARGWTPVRYLAHARIHARSALLRLAWMDPALVRLILRTRERDGRPVLLTEADYERFLASRTGKGNRVHIRSLMRAWGYDKAGAEAERARVEDLVMRLLADVETRRRL